MKTIRSIILTVAAVGTLSAAAAWQSDSFSTKGPPPHPEGVIDSLRQPDDGPTYWKGNLHTHSLWSDGDDFPEMIADWFKRQDYDFLTMSDHNVLSEGDRWVPIRTTGTFPEAVKKYEERFGNDWVERRPGARGGEEVRLKPLVEFRSVLDEPGKFLLIQGEEITHRFGSKPVHLNGINLRDVIPPIDGDNVGETISVNRRAVEEQSRKSGRPMLSFLNHPNFGWGVTAEDIIEADELRYFEVYNGHPGVRNYGDKDHLSTEQMWDVVLAARIGKRKGPVLLAVATDDSHRYHRWGVGQVNPGRGWVMVKAPYLTAGAIVNAMLAGEFYCSTGVTLTDVRRDGDELQVIVKPDDGVKYTIDFIATMRDAPLDPTEGVYSDEIGKVVATTQGNEASYRFTGKELYVRAKVTSDTPHPNPYAAGDVEVAWTQPFTP